MYTKQGVRLVFKNNAIHRMNEMMMQSITEDLYRDHDPLNTEWRNAIYTARSHYRKRRRKFWDLWLRELEINRKEPLTGLAARYAPLSGGPQIVAPVFPLPTQDDARQIAAGRPVHETEES